MRPLRAFLFSFSAGFAGLIGVQMLFAQMTHIPPEPPLQVPLKVPVA